MPLSTDNPILGPRFADALAYAHELHRAQIRKGSEIPYVSHLLAVAGIVLEHGGDEDEAIAGLLHDAAEDQGGQPVLDTIALRFGDRVAQIVEGCSDSLAVDDTQKAPWKERKVKYLAHFAGCDASTRRVSMADKLHNCRTTIADLHEHGARTFERFNAARAEQLWFYRAFVDSARALDDGPLARLLERNVAELERLAHLPTPHAATTAGAPGVTS